MRAYRSTIWGSYVSIRDNWWLCQGLGESEVGGTTLHHSPGNAIRHSSRGPSCHSSTEIWWPWALCCLGTSIFSLFENGFVRTFLSLLICCRFDLLVPIEIPSVLIEHVSQDVLRVLQALNHFQVCRLHSRVEGVGASLSAFVYICYYLGLRTEHDLCVILEVDLYNFVWQTEHDSMSCSHPFLNIHDFFYFTRKLWSHFWVLLKYV